ncbi:hypothetical protein L873DRAFT_1846219 [Choiromyces venosus 120613-1]|uniref:Myb/SANT-like domain-containing protein n=1 Tax=Choiromyces venosus 120613-1 TaxID=1336337 RepID=A0A3N4J9W8_9PEZI|nr:hypothetical protein L873DRAFT_1846219 [Choiromyces venosus 120613-1]
MGNSVWVKGSEEFLIEELLQWMKDGERTENGFKKSVWTSVLVNLNESFKEQLRIPITEQQAKSKESSAHKEARKYRHKSLPFCNQLEELFVSVHAVGHFTRTGSILSAFEEEALDGVWEDEISFPEISDHCSPIRIEYEDAPPSPTITVSSQSSTARHQLIGITRSHSPSPVHGHNVSGMISSTMRGADSPAPHK